MKRLVLLVAGAIAVFIAAAFVLPAIFAIPFVWSVSKQSSCDENSPVVAYARSLPQERLARLYRDMEAYSERADVPFEGWSSWNKKVAAPKEFADLKVARIRPREGNIMVHGCFDHYVYLTFEGIGVERQFAKARRIILSWGERPPEAGEQVLWADATKR